ncbi:MAG: hypothetical protein KDD61_15165 [Bdellovibrionales bacterium]|nr:hypothetical protein [Bdellovibrionales bacterium]
MVGRLFIVILGMVFSVGASASQTIDQIHRNIAEALLVVKNSDSSAEDLGAHMGESQTTETMVNREPVQRESVESAQVQKQINEIVKGALF